MTLPDSRIIELAEYAVKNGLAESEGDFWDQIDFNRTGITAVRRGAQSFRVKHIIKACNITGASADWVLGLENSMFRQVNKPTIQTLKEIIAEMEGKRGSKVNHWNEMQFAKNKLHA